MMKWSQRPVQNLFKLLVAAARMRPKRKTIVAERGNFPSDNHIVESVARMMGLNARFVLASAQTGKDWQQKGRPG